MSGAGVPAIGVPSWLTLAAPALASALARVIAAQVWPGAIRAGSTARCEWAGGTATATIPVSRTTAPIGLFMLASCTADGQPIKSRYALWPVATSAGR